MFAKVFEQIFDSSIAENWQTRLVFEDLLTLADINGVVDKTPEAIARRTNVPLDIILEGIKVLESPDPRSRRNEQEGRRIVRLDEHRDWGWLIVNYGYYRALASEEQRRSKTAERVRKYREKEECNAVVTPVTNCNDSPSTSTSTSLQEGSAGGNQPKVVPPPREWCEFYAKEIGFAGWESWFDHFESNGWKVSGKTRMKDWQAAMRNGKKMNEEFAGQTQSRKPTTKPRSGMYD